MAKIDKVQEVAVGDIKPYPRNAKKHPEDQVDKIAKSIVEFGFISPCLIDKNYNLIAGHGRLKAAEKLGLHTVPCLFVEGLTEDERKAYILADNRLTELGGWDNEILIEELRDLDFSGIDVEITGFYVPDSDKSWFEDRQRFDTSREEGNEEYNEFLDKFKPKKTTDDCYTPDVVYEAIANFVNEEYGIARDVMTRPFYPGGDYQSENYDGKVVVDNPPFSIMSEIVRFYSQNGVKFFLFANALTLFSMAQDECCCALPVNAQITYENGANVSTSFLTNLEPESVKIRVCNKLYKAAKKANDENLKTIRTAQRKYKYPDEVITASAGGYMSKYGQDLRINRDDCVRVSELDAQKETGDAIFGGGYLLSEKAAAERAAAEKAAAERAAAEKAAAEVWELSEREIKVVKELGKVAQNE